MAWAIVWFMALSYITCICAKTFFLCLANRGDPFNTEIRIVAPLSLFLLLTLAPIHAYILTYMHHTLPSNLFSSNSQNLQQMPLT